MRRRIGEYKVRHRAFDPPVKGAWQETGWSNDSSFLADGLPFGSLETGDFERSRAN